MGLLELDESAAASDARLCGAIDSTGTLWDGKDGSGFDCKKFKTSVCDWRVMRTDSADVIHPLEFQCLVNKICLKEC
jgi:hypothetical protein